MKSVITLLLILSFCAVAAQNLPATSIINESGFIADKELDKGKIVGSVLLNADWVLDAVIYTTDDKTYLPKSINYNVELKTFVVKIAEDSLFTLDKAKVKSIQFNNKSFEILNNTYYQNIAKGKLNVYKEYYLDLKKGAIDPISKSKISEDKYVIKNRYHLKKDELMEELRVSKKNVLKLCDKDKVGAVKTFIKKNDLSVKKDLDLSKILEYYNAL